jgi:hypothetical protein
MAPAGVEPAPRRLRVGRSPLSYGAEQDVAGRSRTCGAPRFRRPLYRAELRPRGMGEAGFEPATSCVLNKHSGQAELLAHVKAPGQGFEPRSPRSERGVLTARRSRITDGCAAVPSVHLAGRGRRSGTPRLVVRSSFCHVRLKPNDVVQATRLPFDPGSPSRRPTWRGFGARRSCHFEKSQAKAAGNSAANSACAKRRGAFLS